MNDFVERLKTYLKDNNIKQSYLCEKFGYTRGYVSAIVNNKKAPSKNFIKNLSEISGKSENWWLTGKEEYDNLDSLNALLNTLIETGNINEDGSMSDEIKTIVFTMLEKEIRTKLKNKTQHK